MKLFHEILIHVLKSIYFLNLMHSIIEDTALVLLIGANIFIVVIGRLLFSISVLLMLNFYWAHLIQKNPTKSSNWPEKPPILRQLISGELMLKEDSAPCFPASLNAISKVLIIIIDLIQKLYHNIKLQQFQTTI
jgi:hypothetical protein